MLIIFCLWCYFLAFYYFLFIFSLLVHGCSKQYLHSLQSWYIPFFTPYPFPHCSLPSLNLLPFTFTLPVWSCAWIEHTLILFIILYCFPFPSPSLEPFSFENNRSPCLPFCTFHHAFIIIEGSHKRVTMWYLSMSVYFTLWSQGVSIFLQMTQAPPSTWQSSAVLGINAINSLKK